VPKLEQICYSAANGRAKGQVTLFVSERAVFRIGVDGLELIEIAPGIDVERDVIAHMGFRPHLARDLREMDARIFRPSRMDLASYVHAKPRRYRSARLAQWHEARTASVRSR
jgi:propionate CoA-transferase